MSADLISANTSVDTATSPTSLGSKGADAPQERDLLSRIRAAGSSKDYDSQCREALAPIERARGSLSPMERCLAALVVALRPGEDGGSWEIARAMLIGGTRSMDLTDFENSMAQMGYAAEAPVRCRVSRLTRDRLPCLFLPNAGGAWVVEDITEAGVRLFDGAVGTVRLVPKSDVMTTGTVIIFSPFDVASTTQPLTPDRWLSSLLWRLSPTIRRYIALVALLNVFALGVPLYSMQVFDVAIATRSVETLVFLTIGITILLLFDFAVRRIRNHQRFLLGARFSYLLASEVLGRLTTMTLVAGEAATVGSKMPRIKDVDRIQGFLFGGAGQALVEAPFAVLFILIIGYLGGVLVVVPVITVILFLIAGLCFGRWIKQKSATASSASSSLQSLLLEGVTKMPSIKVIGANRRWSERIDLAFATSAAAAYQANTIQSLVQTFGTTLGYATGLAVMTLGVHLILAGQLTAGGLIATMMLIWRIVTPIQGVYLALTRFWQVRSSIDQITSLLRLRSERPAAAAGRSIATVQGRIEFSNVSFRFPGGAEPVASGLSFVLHPGESLAVVGANGSGKSSVLKLACGLYRPQVGSVLIDGQDIQQFDPWSLRRHVSFAPQTPQFFEGTIRENLNYAHPLASEDDMASALDAAGAWEIIEAYPAKLDTPVVTHGNAMLSYSMLIRLNLARAFLKPAPIVLLDEPIIGVDLGGDFAFLEALERLHGRASVMAVTHRPGHIRAVDKVLYLAQGRIRFFGRLEGAEDKLLNDLSKGTG